MINWINALMVSLLMTACIGADMDDHNYRRRRLWILAGFFLGPVGVGAYLLYDRWKK